MTPSHNIRFVFFNGKSLTSKAIKLFTRSKWSHVGIWFSDSSIIEAWSIPDGKRGLHWGYSSLANHTPGTPYEVWDLPVGSDMYEYCMSEYFKYANDKMNYAFRAIIAFLSKRRTNLGSGQICSEGSSRPVIEYNGMSDIDPAHLSPEDWYRMLRMANATRTVTGLA
jgi:hypothetical protein